MLEENQLVETYRKISRELYIYIYRLTGSSETSEDLLHDCFVNLIKYSKNHKIETKNIRAFLYKTAHNLSVNYLKRRANIEFSPIETSGNFSTKDNVTSEIEHQELNDKITQLLSGLDSVSRSIFIMRKEHGMSIQEIAENTGKSERTVSRHLRKVINHLENGLKKSGFINSSILFVSLI